MEIPFFLLAVRITDLLGVSLRIYLIVEFLELCRSRVIDWLLYRAARNSNTAIVSSFIFTSYLWLIGRGDAMGLYRYYEDEARKRKDGTG